MKYLFKKMIILFFIGSNLSFIQNPKIDFQMEKKFVEKSSNAKNVAKEINKNILVKGSGDAKENKLKENRQFAHSQFIPTGIFAIQGATITTKIDYRSDINFKNLMIFVGQWGPYANLNDGKQINPQKFIIYAPNMTITTFEEGMVYLGNTSQDSELIINIHVSEAINVPTFKLDETGVFDFDMQLKNNTNSPFVELIGNKIFATLQMKLIQKVIAKKNPQDFIFNEIIAYWDKVVNLSNLVSGLDNNQNSHHYKYHNKIHIINPDSGAGYAYASESRISFQIDTGAGADLIEKNKYFNNWGLWHEIGHTYQNPDYLFDYFGEVTVNINAFFIEEKLGLPSRILNRKNDIELMKKFLESENKQLEKQNEWVKLGLFYQLHIAYGDFFFNQLNISYRNLFKDKKPKTNDEKKQLFIIMCSSLINKNLIPFFEKWGIKATKETTTYLSSYNKLEKPIWLNIIEKNKITDN